MSPSSSLILLLGKAEGWTISCFERLEYSVLLQMYHLICSTPMLVIFSPDKFPRHRDLQCKHKIAPALGVPLHKVETCHTSNSVWGSVLMFLSWYSSLNLSHPLESCLRGDHTWESPESPHLVQTSAPVMALGSRTCTVGLDDSVFT